MTRIDTKRPLSPQTVARILDYLEKRPLCEVLGLFSEIVSQLEVKETNGESGATIGVDAATPGQRDGSLGGDRISVVAAK